MGYIKDAKKYLKENFDEVSEKSNNQLRNKFLHRWARLSDSPNPDDPNTIDWTNKYVRLENMLCDIGLWMRLSDPKM